MAGDNKREGRERSQRLRMRNEKRNEKVRSDQLLLMDSISNENPMSKSLPNSQS